MGAMCHDFAAKEGSRRGRRTIDVPYRIPAENDYAALEAEEIRRDVAAMRRASGSDRVRILALVGVVAVTAWIGYATFHRHADEAAQGSPCRTVIVVTSLGEKRETYCGAFTR